VDSFIADHPSTSTFRIKGLRINTKCTPGLYPGVPKPKLDVVMENGTPPYTYAWNTYVGHNVFIEKSQDTNVNSILSTIYAIDLGAVPPYVFNARLTVWDSSPIQKVANKTIRFTLITDSTWDLAMQDS